MPEQGQQLSLDVGGEVGAYVVSEFGIGGKVASWDESLDRDEQVMVSVANADGQIVFTSLGVVKAVTIETVPETKSVPRHTKRKHSIKLTE